jgi:signal transduction histidine kinase
MIGKTDFDFYSEELASQFFAVEQALIQSGQPLIACEQLVPNLQTGEPGWLQTTKVHLRDSEGKVIGLLGLARDITERKRFEGEIQSRNQELSELNAKLSQAQEQLMQSEKLASIGQLAAGVAHEINNPIGFILSNFNSLESYMKKVFDVLSAYSEALHLIVSPEVLAHLDKVREAADLDFLVEDSGNLMAETKDGIKRVQRIVQDLKDFSQVDVRSEWTWSNLQRGIDSTLNILASEIKNKADVVKEYGEIPDVECLSAQINQVIMCLLLNAVDAIGSKRGTITLRTGTEGQEVWIEVSDTGCGIPKKILPRIFDPFFTTKPIGKGTGLGLSLSYGILQRHHGRIDVESEPGKGSTFKVSLPIKRTED